MIIITVIWGEHESRRYAEGTPLNKLDQSRVCQYPFKTKMEAKAFLKGLSEAHGWLDWETIINTTHRRRTSGVKFSRSKS